MKQPEYIWPPADKSTRKAVLLELYLPGAGAMYAGKVRVGIIWLIASTVDVVLVITFFVGSDAVAEEYYGILFIVAFLLVLANFVWLMVRLALVGDYVREFNAVARQRRRRHSSHSAEHP